METLIILVILYKITLDNWNKSNILHSSKYNNFMSFNRFYLLHRYIHFGGFDILDKKDRLRKIRGVVDYIVKKWQVYYQPGKRITVDESMIKNKGNCKILQYIKNKPVRWGIKAFLLCDSTNYYCCNAILYAGKSTNNGNINEKFSTTEKTVISLVEPYFNHNRIVYCDNFFTSMRLEEYLREKKTGIIGVWRANKIPDFRNLLIPDKNMYVSYKFKNNNNFILTIWNDKKIVNILNNCFPVTTFLKEKKTNNFRVIPSIVNDYNKFSRGVDANNQNTYHFRFPHKSRRWTRSVFFHFIHVSIYNAFILYKNKFKNTKFKQFYEDIVTMLLGYDTKNKKIKAIHNIKYIDTEKKTQQRCVRCKKKTVWCCTVCLNSPVYLCLPKCYNIYHYNPYNI